MNRITKLETPEEKIKRIKIKETIRNGLDELNILKINRKKRTRRNRIEINDSKRKWKNVLTWSKNFESSG